MSMPDPYITWKDKTCEKCKFKLPPRWHKGCDKIEALQTELSSLKAKVAELSEIKEDMTAAYMVGCSKGKDEVLAKMEVGEIGKILIGCYTATELNEDLLYERIVERSKKQATAIVKHLKGEGI